MTDAVVRRSRLEGVRRRAREAIAAVRPRASAKPEALDRFGCVVGVKDASFEVAARRDLLHHGAVGLGQVDAGAPCQPPDRALGRAIEVLGRDVSPASESDLRAMRAQHIGMVFQHMALMPHRSVRDNVGYPLEVRGVPKSKRWAVSDHALNLVDLGRL
jgi:glycine betaine/proline transport system ATP-binding protein